MKHNYIDKLKEELNEKKQEIIDLANDDLEYYFENKDDEDYSFSEEMIQESEDLGKEYRFTSTMDQSKKDEMIKAVENGIAYID